MKTLPIAELRELLTVVSEHGNQHLVEVESDLQQTNYLLNEAIEKLGESFMSIHKGLVEQQAIVEKLLANQEIAQNDKASLEALKNKITQDVNAAVTGLQFQDMTSQLIHRTIKRVNGLKDLLEILANHGVEHDDESEHEDIAKFLASLNNSFHESSHALSGGLLNRSVGQKDMGSGEIDLF